jgi:hypothetical protein
MNPALFGERMEEGVYSAAKKLHKPLVAIKKDIGAHLGYSTRTIELMMQGTKIPDDPNAVEKLLDYFRRESRVGHDRQWAVDFLKHAGYPDPDQLLNKYYPKDRRQIFICFDRSAEQDLHLVLTLAQKLSSWCNVFQDQPKSVDASWTGNIVGELEKAEFVIVLLSIDSVNSEVMQFELDQVIQLAANGGLPRILLVRMEYLGPAFTETFGDQLDSERWVSWFSPDDTPTVVQAISEAIRGESVLPFDDEQLQQMRAERPNLLTSEQPAPSAQVISLESPEGGTMSPNSAFYVERESDPVALEAIQRVGTTLVIKGPRQVGKSSLLLRIVREAERVGKRVAYLDFQLLKSAVADTDAFFRNFCAHVARQLNLEPRLSAYWDDSLTHLMNCNHYMSSHILRELESPLTLAIDEADVVFGAPFQSDFFAMLRAWHNDRAHDRHWKRLDLVVVTSTEPYAFIKDLNQSPFNVGEQIPLQNFSIDQIAQMNSLHNRPLTREQLDQLKALLWGQPFLTRRALYLVAKGRLLFTELLSRAVDDDGPFGDHLRALLFRVANDAALKQGLRQVLQDNLLTDELLYFRLRGAGLVRRDNNTVVFRCQLYADFFSRHLNE